MQRAALPERWYEELLRWFAEQGRRFPWRESTAGWYEILVAEIMLQRTRAETVLKIYREFLSRYPTPQELCKADEDDLRSFFKRLGLINRASRLKHAVCVIIERFGGRPPCSADKLKAVPGIGDYIASVLLSRVCGIPTPFVDSNVVRVMSRVLGVTGRFSDVKEVVERAIAEGVPSELLVNVNTAIIDLAALICKPKRPRCGQCPLRNVCIRGRSRGEVKLT